MRPAYGRPPTCPRSGARGTRARRGRGQVEQAARPRNEVAAACRNPVRGATAWTPWSRQARPTGRLDRRGGSTAWTRGLDRLDRRGARPRNEVAAACRNPVRGATALTHGLDKPARRGGATGGGARRAGRLDHLDPWSRQARPTGGATEERGRGSASKPGEGRDRLDPWARQARPTGRRDGRGGSTGGAARPPGSVVSTGSTDGGRDRGTRPRQRVETR